MHMRPFGSHLLAYCSPLTSSPLLPPCSPFPSLPLPIKSSRLLLPLPALFIVFTQLFVCCPERPLPPLPLCLRRLCLCLCCWFKTTKMRNEFSNGNWVFGYRCQSWLFLQFSFFFLLKFPPKCLGARNRWTCAWKRGEKRDRVVLLLLLTAG